MVLANGEARWVVKFGASEQKEMRKMSRGGSTMYEGLVGNGDEEEWKIKDRAMGFEGLHWKRAVGEPKQTQSRSRVRRCLICV